MGSWQREAIRWQFRAVAERGEQALVIGAGTGAGKTKAFYIPALAEVAATLDALRWVQVLALYPRVELLKDQLAEAHAEARKLDNDLRAADRRSIALGAYYGDTPLSAARFLESPPDSWRSAEEVAFRDVLRRRRRHGWREDDGRACDYADRAHHRGPHRHEAAPESDRGAGFSLPRRARARTSLNVRGVGRAAGSVDAGTSPSFTSPASDAPTTRTLSPSRTR